MIINPFDAEPSEHLYFRDYRLRWRDELGRRTIFDVLHLNDTEKLVSVRMELGSAICDALKDIRCDLEEYVGGDTTVRKRAKIIRGLERLLREAQPGSEFSALAATVLLTDPDYLWIKERISEFEEWPELESLEEAARMLLLME